MQNPPPVEEQGFQQQSHATGLDHAQFCQLAVLTAIFLVRLMERTRAVKRKKVIHSSSRRYWAEVCTCFTSRCLCSLCTLAVVCQSMRVYFKLFIRVIVFFFWSLLGACLCGSSGVCMYTLMRSLQSPWSVRNMSSHASVSSFVCVVCSHKDRNGTLQSRDYSQY